MACWEMPVRSSDQVRRTPLGGAFLLPTCVREEIDFEVPVFSIANQMKIIVLRKILTKKTKIYPHNYNMKNNNFF